MDSQGPDDPLDDVRARQDSSGTVDTSQPIQKLVDTVHKGSVRVGFVATDRRSDGDDTKELVREPSPLFSLSIDCLRHEFLV